MHIILIIVLIKTESTRYTTNNSFGEIINKFQNCNMEKKVQNIWTLGRKKEKNNIKITRIRFYLIKPV